LWLGLRILLRIKTGAVPLRNDAVIEAAATTLGMDMQVLKDVQTQRAGTTPLGEERLKQLYGEFMAEVGRAADLVDAMFERSGMNWFLHNFIADMPPV
jgi:hypothetical protein